MDLCLQSYVSVFEYAIEVGHSFSSKEQASWISQLQSPSAVILEPKKIKSVTVSIVSPSICHEVMGPDAMLLIFQCWVISQLFHCWVLSQLFHCWVLSQLFHCWELTAFSLSSFIFTMRLFSSSSLSAIRVVSSAYLRLWIFLPAIFMPACASSSPAFHMMYSAYKLNKQGDNIQSCHTLFPIWSQSVVPCSFLTVASWPAYRFLRRQVRWSGICISFRIFHSMLWSTQSKALA